MVFLYIRIFPCYICDLIIKSEMYLVLFKDWDALRDLVPFVAFNFAKSNTPSWVFFAFLKLNK